MARTATATLATAIALLAAGALAGCADGESESGDEDVFEGKTRTLDAARGVEDTLRQANEKREAAQSD